MENQPAVEPDQTEQPAQAPEQVTDEQDVKDEVVPETPVEDDEDFPAPPTVPQVKPLTVEDLKTDPQTGDVDLNAFLGTVNERLTQAQQAAVTESTSYTEMRDRYRTEWEKAETKYPELKENKAYRDWVYARHADAIERSGKWMSPSKAADEFFAFTKQAKTAGIESAQKNVEVQKSAQLETANSNTPSTNVAADLQARLDSRNPTEARQARMEVLKQRIKEGRL